MPVNTSSASVTDLLHLKLIEAKRNGVDSRIVNKYGDMLRNVSSTTSLISDQDLLQEIERQDAKELALLGFEYGYIETLREKAVEGDRFKNQSEIDPSDDLISAEGEDIVRAKTADRFIKPNNQNYEDYGISQGMNKTDVIYKRIKTQGFGKNHKSFVDSKYMQPSIEKYNIQYKTTVKNDAYLKNYATNSKRYLDVRTVSDDVNTAVNEPSYSEFVAIFAPDQAYKIRKVEGEEYNLQPIGAMQVKLIPNCQTLYDILANAQNTYKLSKVDAIVKITREYNIDRRSVFKTRIIAFAFGIRDRHDGNVLINDGKIFNIDFGRLKGAGHIIAINKFSDAIRSNDIDYAKKILLGSLESGTAFNSLVKDTLNNMSDEEFVRNIADIFADESKLEQMNYAWDKYWKKHGSTQNHVDGTPFRYNAAEACNLLAQTSVEYLKAYKSENAGEKHRSDKSLNDFTVENGISIQKG